jgi:CheY-like chemotaxis protein
MPKVTRILIAEDMPSDYELACRAIRQAIPASEFRRVETSETFLAEMAAFEPDLVISDYRMPRFDGLTALRLALERAPHTPVVILTGAINEDTAVECMKAGAADYVIKEHLKRLGQAVVRVLEEREERLRRREAEAALNESNERLQQLAANIDSVLFVSDLVDGGPRLSYLSPACERIFGVGRTELARDPMCWMDNIAAADRPAVERALEQIMSGAVDAAEVRYRVARERTGARFVRLKAQVVRTGDGGPRGWSESPKTSRPKPRRRRRRRRWRANSSRPRRWRPWGGWPAEWRTTSIT